MEEIATEFVWFLKQCRTWGPSIHQLLMAGEPCCFTPNVVTVGPSSPGVMLLDQLCKKLIRKSNFWCEAQSNLYGDLMI